MGYLLFQRIRHQHQHLLILIQQQHDPQIPQPLVTESRTRNQFQAFDLSEMGGIAQHVDVEQFRDVVVSSEGVFFLE